MPSWFDDLSRFSLSMCQCLSAGLPPAKALSMSATTVRPASWRHSFESASEMCALGIPISEALEKSGGSFPSFFIPVVQAGELGGRQVEAYRLIHDHCERLKPASLAVRNAWLYPLVCILAGWSIRLAIFLYFGKYHLAWLFLRDTMGSSALLALLGLALSKTEYFRLWIDSLILQLPVIGETQRRLGTLLFLSTFRLIYEAGGLPVLSIVDLSLRTVGNRALRLDFARIRPVLAENGGFEDAFTEPLLLEDHVKGWIATGALSGSLGTALDQIVRSESQQLEHSLDLFNRIFQRLVAFGVAMSIVGTLLLCLSYSN